MTNSPAIVSEGGQEKETLSEELGRLISAFRTGEVQQRQECWNLIADCVIENGDKIIQAVADAEKVRP